MTESGGEVQHESTVWLFRGSPLSQVSPDVLSFTETDVLIGIDLLEVRPSSLFDKVNRESDGIRRNVPTKSVSLDNSVWLFRDALTFTDVN